VFLFVLFVGLPLLFVGVAVFGSLAAVGGVGGNVVTVGSACVVTTGVVAAGVGSVVGRDEDAEGTSGHSCKRFPVIV